MRGAAQTIEGESMSLLSDQQWELFYEAVRRFLGAETIERFAQESLGGFAALVPARQYMLFTFKGYASDRIEYDQAYTYGTAVHYMDRFLNGGYTEEDRIFSRMSLKISDCAYRDSDIIDEETLVNLRMYKEIYEKDGVHYGMRINMASEGRLVGSYSIFRPREDGDFSELELDIANTSHRCYRRGSTRSEKRRCRRSKTTRSVFPASRPWITTGYRPRVPGRRAGGERLLGRRGR